MGAFLPKRRKTRPVSHSFLCLAFFFPVSHFYLRLNHGMSVIFWCLRCLPQGCRKQPQGIILCSPTVLHRDSYFAGCRSRFRTTLPPARYGAGSHTARICTRKYSHSESTKVYHAVPPALSTGVWSCISIVRIWWRCRKSHGRSNQSAKQHMPADHTGQGW